MAFLFFKYFKYKKHVLLLLFPLLFHMCCFDVKVSKVMRIKHIQFIAWVQTFNCHFTLCKSRNIVLYRIVLHVIAPQTCKLHWNVIWSNIFAHQSNVKYFFVLSVIIGKKKTKQCEWGFYLNRTTLSEPPIIIITVINIGVKSWAKVPKRQANKRIGASNVLAIRQPS